MNWDNQLSSILSVAEGSVAKMRVRTFRLLLFYLLVLLEIKSIYSYWGECGFKLKHDNSEGERFHCAYCCY